MTDNTVNSVDEAANKYADKHSFRVPFDGTNKFYDDNDFECSKEGFLAGAEWQSKQQSIPIQKEFKTDSVTVILPDNK